MGTRGRTVEHNKGVECRPVGFEPKSKEIHHTLSTAELGTLNLTILYAKWNKSTLESASPISFTAMNIAAWLLANPTVIL